MASTTLRPNGYNHYNGSWDGWSTTYYGGYSGRVNYGTVLRYAVPTNLAFFGPPYELTVEVPWIRQGNSATSGTFTAYLFTTDPTGGRDQ